MLSDPRVMESLSRFVFISTDPTSPEHEESLDFKMTGYVPELVVVNSAGATAGTVNLEHISTIEDFIAQLDTLHQKATMP